MERVGKDENYFDLPYSIAWTLVMYAVFLIYAPVCPLITILAVLFFGIKYVVDKYNLVHIYPKGYDSKNPYSQRLLPFLANLMLFGN